MLSAAAKSFGNAADGTKLSFSLVGDGAMNLLVLVEVVGVKPVYLGNVIGIQWAVSFFLHQHSFASGVSLPGP